MESRTYRRRLRARLLALPIAVAIVAAGLVVGLAGPASAHSQSPCTFPSGGFTAQPYNGGWYIIATAYQCDFARTFADCIDANGNVGVSPATQFQWTNYGWTNVNSNVCWGSFLGMCMEVYTAENSWWWSYFTQTWDYKAGACWH